MRLLAVALAASACTSTPSGPTVELVEPTRWQAGSAQAIAVIGRNFYSHVVVDLNRDAATVHDDFEVRLGETVLHGVERLSAERLIATAPADLPPGTYDLWLRDPRGQSASLGGAVTVLTDAGADGACPGCVDGGADGSGDAGDPSPGDPISGDADVDNCPPVATFVADPGGGPAPLMVTLDASASSDVETPGALLYDWDLDGDGTVDASGQIVQPQLTTTGLHSITLTVTDPSNASDRFVGQVVVVGGGNLIVVDSAADVVADDGVTTLREAVAHDAELTPHVITFAGPMEIELTETIVVGQSDIAIVGRPGVSVRGPGIGDCIDIRGHRAVVAALEVKGCSAACVLLVGSDESDVRGNWLHDCDLGVEVDGGVNVRVGPENLIEEHDVGVLAGAVGLRVFDNHLRDNVTHGVLVTGAALNVLLVGNVIEDCREGVRIDNTIDGTALWHNVIAGALEYGVHVRPVGQGHDVRNNVLLGNATDIQGGANWGPFTHNLFWDNEGEHCHNCPTPTVELLEPPGFIDVAAGDYRLRSDSPCIDAGDDTGEDRNGSASGAFEASAPDIGAFER